MQPGERHHVDSQFPQISIELAREAQTGGHSTHCSRDKVVQVTVGGSGELQCAETDVIQGLIINAVGLICVLNQLVDRQGGVVRLHHRVRHLEDKERKGDDGSEENNKKTQLTNPRKNFTLNIFMLYIYLRRRHHTERVHDAVWILLSDLADEQRAHARAGASSEGMSELEALEAVAALRLLPHHIQDRVHQLSSLRVVAFSPVVTCSALACDPCKYSN